MTQIFDCRFQEKWAALNLEGQERKLRRHIAPFTSLRIKEWTPLLSGLDEEEFALEYMPNFQCLKELKMMSN